MNLMRKLSASELLTPYESQIDEIREIVGLTPEHFGCFYQKPIERYVELVQLSPASELHHHAHVGGMIEHNFDVVINALRIRRGLILPPGISAEDIERKKDIWTYAVFVAALLHDIGKPITDFCFVNKEGKAWDLLSTHAMPGVYEIRYRKNRVHKFHERLPMLVMHRIIEPKAIEWLNSDAEVFQNLMFFLSGEHGSTPIVSDIVQKADQLSVAGNLGGDIKKMAASTVERPLHERFLNTIKLLLSEENVLPLNRKGAAAYVCEKDNRVYFVSKRLLDEVKERMRKEGQSVPGRNDRLMDELQQFNVLISNGDRAIWRCKVRIDDWEQSLSMLCFDVSKIWPNLSERPDVPENMSVVPVEISTEPTKTKSEVAVKSKKLNKSKPEAVIKKEPVSKNNTAEATEPDPLSELDDILAIEPEQAVDNIGDYSEFNDADINDYELPNNESKSEINSPEVKKKKKIRPEKERVLPVDEKNALLEEIIVAANKGRSNTVAYHNAKVAEQSESTIEFDDPNCPAAQFVRWLVKGVSEGSIPINNPANQVHFVEEGLFMVSPAIFKTFERDAKLSWKIVQRDFTRKKLNLKNQKGENIFQYEISSRSGRNSLKIIKGILIPDPKKIGLKSSQLNEYLRIING